MMIQLAEEKDLRDILRYDRHIQPVRLEGCVRAGQVYVLREGERTLGVLRYNLFWQTIPFVDLLYIDDRYRGRGYGRQMMGQWEEDMAAAGFDHVMLSTQEDETAKFFYEKLGYRRIGAFCPPEQEADELMYLKKLHGPNGGALIK